MLAVSAPGSRIADLSTAMSSSLNVPGREVRRNIFSNPAKSSRLIHHSGIEGSWKKNIYQLRSSWRRVRFFDHTASGGTCSAASFQT